MRQHLLEMAPRTDLVAKKMFGHAHHALAEQPIARVRPTRCQIMELLRKWQRSTVSTAPGVIEIQAPESAQLVLGVAKALRDVECLRERRAHLGSLRCRCAQRGVQPHFLARVPVPPVPRAPSACLARLRHSSSSDRRIQRGTAAAVSATPIDRIAARRKGPVERRAQIVDFPGVIGQPFARRPRRRFTFGALEKIAVVLGVAARDPFALAALVELLDRVGAGRVEQPEPRFGAADIRDDQRFRHQIGQAVYRIDARLCCIHRHGSGSLDRKAAGKDAESPEEPLLVLAQQTVAPIEDGPHRPVPRHCRAAPRLQQRQAVVQAGGKAFDPKHLDARRGELDRQRQAVEPPANLDDQRGVRIGQREVFDDRGDTLDEQLHGGESCRLGGRQSRTTAAGCRAVRGGTRAHPLPRAAPGWSPGC